MKDIKSTESVDELDKASANPRRQFFKKAAVGSALLTTISSRPVWAAGCTVSGEMSGNLSNPDRNDCDSKATGKSPGYWQSWRSLYDFFESNRGVRWRDLGNGDKNKFKFGGEGNAVNVLYNWVIAANHSGGAITLPAINGEITRMGDILSPGGGSDVDFNYCGALLSAAHPNILFPYPNNQWTLQYLITNYNDPDYHNITHTLVASFFKDHLEPNPTLPLYSGDNRKAAFKWAKDILGF